ncbi:MAG: M61 family peptidase, partial [Chitinophagaceae bacterium]
MKLTSLFALLFCISAAVAQQPIRYEVSFPNYVHHEARIKMFIPQVKGVVALRMSRSSPGRYATHEFGKNVYDVTARDSVSGREIKVIQKDGDVYSVAYTGKSLIVEYTLFGDHVDGTYAAIDRQHAHFNMPASFMWAIGQEKRPLEISFAIPAGTNWKIATQLKPGKTANQFSAPDLQYFMDSPTELADFKERSWTVKDTDGKTKTIAVILHGDVSDALMDEYTEEIKKIVTEAGKVFGQLPDFDFGRYTFMIDLMPNNDGDGMEHRNSTIITGRA